MKRKLNTVRIPKSFTLLGHTWTVEWSTSLDDYLEEGESALAVCLSGTHRIIMLKHPELKVLTPGAVQQIYLHELTHALLDAAGKPKLSEDESFVNLLSELLYQALSTAEY